jgi:hypothetical protein
LRIDGPTAPNLNSVLDRWLPPAWLEPLRHKIVRKKGNWFLHLRDKATAISEDYAFQLKGRLLAYSEHAARTFIPHREEEIRARLGFVLELSIGENVEKLLSLNQAQTCAPTPQRVAETLAIKMQRLPAT